MPKNNLLRRVNLSLFKTSPDLFKAESATAYYHSNPYISPIARALQCPMIGRQGKKKNCSFKLSSLYPITKSRTELRCFLVFILLHYYLFLFYKKMNDSAGSADSPGFTGFTGSTGSAGSGGPRSVDQ